MDALLPRLEAWRRKLLDLSRRNRLLHFRPSRRTTISSRVEVPAELYRQLVHEGRSLRFLPGAPRPRTRPRPAAPRKEPAPPAAPVERAPAGLEVAVSLRRCPFCHEDVGGADEALVCAECLSRHHAECWGEHGRCASCGASRALAEAAQAAAPASGPGPAAPGEAPAWARVAREALSPEQQDDALATDLGPEELPATLLALHRAAATTLEEQGFSALFLALGFLEWTDAAGAASRAPILLLPVELRRRGLSERFTLLAGEDDPLLNPALAHKLAQEDGIALPELGDPDELDPDEVYAALAQAVAGRAGWRVTSEVALALFSFTKLVMWKDLELHRERVLAHPLVRRLLGDPAPPGPAGPAREPSSCVLDADGSQLEAIAAALSGQDLVLEGPPGTGKSQTIANLIAEALSGGKSVLFVSEKMAALEVVRDRLTQAGLGDACLELHSKKANKRALVQELARTLEQERPPDHAEDDALAALLRAAERLDGHARALHAPWGAARRSPWQLVSELTELADAPEVPHLLECSAWSGEALREREAALQALAAREAETGDPAAHPCRGLGAIDPGHAGELALQAALTELLERTLPPFAEAARELAAALPGVAAPESAAAAEAALGLGPLLLDPERPPAAEVLHPAWNGPLPAELLELRGRLAELSRQLAARLGEAAWSLEEPLALAQRLQGWQGTWWRAFAPSFWRDRGRARALLLPGQDPDPAHLVRDLTTLTRAQELRGKLAAHEAEGRALFGAAWQLEPEALRARADRVQALRAAVQRGLSPAALEPLPDPARARAAAAGLRARLDALRAAWAALRAAAAWDDERGLGGPFPSTPLPRVRERLGELRAAREQWRAWAAREAALRAAEGLGLEPFLGAARGVLVPTAALPRALRRAALSAWLDLCEHERPELRRFERADHERLRDEFQALDLRRQELARVRLRHLLATRRPDPRWEAAQDSELGLLQREVRRKRGHLPVRQLLARVPAALRQLKPCLLMSPLTVALFTDPRQHAFDLVVFDEASQIAPEDALGAIARGKQVVVVGDGRQLPPTSFFRPVGATEQEAPEPDLESVLDECLARGVTRRLLRWHYRSRHESLIAFSNHAFYGGRLCSFPSPHPGQGRLGLSRVRVDGVYERGGSGRNLPEAVAVAEAVIAHLRATPERSLGVGAFSQAQQEAIQDAVEARARAHPELEPLLASEREERFFVKNLENLQGDERDVVFISVGYGPDAQGKLSLNMGPLNQAGGERRLNVLVTRAREQVVLFTSFEPEALDPARTQSEGVRQLRAYLDYAARGALPARPAAAGGQDPLERAALRAALRRALEAGGHRVDEELGTSEVKLDLAVRAPAGEGHTLGVVLDGPRWARFERARDRERLIPALLLDQGWRLHPVWALDWLRHPRRAREALLAAADAAALAASAPAPDLAAAPDQAVAAPGQAAAPTTLTATTIGPRRRPATIRLRAAAAEASPVQPYRALEVAPRGDSEAFSRLEAGALRDLVVEVVRVEGPIHVEEVERRALAHWELTRGGKAARQRVGEALDAAERQGQLRRQGPFLWPPGPPAAPVRDRSQSGPRAPELIPPEELDAALALVVRKEVRVPPETLVLQAARLLGFPRPGARVKATLEGRLDLAVQSGRLALDGGVVVNSPGT